MKPTFLLTSGGTKVKIDMVRSITNMSRGTFGSRIAEYILFYGYKLSFLHAKESRLPGRLIGGSALLENYIPKTFVTFEDYEKSLNEELKKKPDIIILAAAVSDYGVDNYIDGKIRSNDALVIKLKPLPKLISKVREKCPSSIICGFKLLVNSTEKELREAAVESLVKNKLDLVVGNDLRDIKAGQHKLLIVENKSNSVVSSTYENNLPKVVVNKCMEHWQLGVLR
jgi:phosphopantothenoylcysteine synthetase/decarboxylase